MSTGKGLIIIGVVLVGLSLFLLWGGKLPAFGQLPGDFISKKGNVTIYFPLFTGLILRGKGAARLQTYPITVRAIPAKVIQIDREVSAKDWHSQNS